MYISKIINYTGKPKLYESGSNFMWTDEHISTQLLNIHLNPELDLASRKRTTIESNVSWILEDHGDESLNILDLGCGPGLYAEILTQKGHKVTGVDISKKSIEYAKNEANKKQLNIKYFQGNYLSIDLEENSFDLVIMIYTDFGVLIPEDRSKLLRLVKHVLKPGGTFVFDVLNTNNLEHKASEKSWEICQHGFWSAQPYLALSESYFFEQESLILYQHLVIDEKDNVKTYRFWTHFFSQQNLENVLTASGFKNIYFSEDVLPEDDIWSGKNVTFTRALVDK